MLFVVADADIVAGNAEGFPRYMELAVAGQELVGIVSLWFSDFFLR